jgi:hypothetical protein
MTLGWHLQPLAIERRVAYKRRQIRNCVISNACLGFPINRVWLCILHTATEDKSLELNREVTHVFSLPGGGQGFDLIPTRRP